MLGTQRLFLANTSNNVSYAITAFIHIFMYVFLCHPCMQIINKAIEDSKLHPGVQPTMCTC